MNRILFPALVLSGPAMAHSQPHVHAHGIDYATLGAGLAVAAAIAVFLLSKLPK